MNTEFLNPKDIKSKTLPKCRKSWERWAFQIPGSSSVPLAPSGGDGLFPDVRPLQSLAGRVVPAVFYCWAEVEQKRVSKMVR